MEEVENIRIMKERKKDKKDRNTQTGKIERKYTEVKQNTIQRRK
jgi:hypothetical protein